MNINGTHTHRDESIHIKALTLGSLTALLIATTAIAQDSGKEPFSLGTIIIGRGWDDGEGGKFPSTASAGMKTETLLIDIPQSVSVVTEAQISGSGASTIGQALAYTPGVFARPSGGNDSTRYDFHSLRGQSYNGALLVDGMRASFGVGNLSLPQFDPSNLERIEAIRGPSSGLYGQGLPGGIVNALTKRPTGGEHRELSFTIGTENRREVEFDLGGGKDGVFDYRLAGVARGSDNQVEFVSEERFAIAPSLRWNLSDRTSLTFFSSYQNDPKGGYYNSLLTSGVVAPLPDGRFVSRSFFVGDPSYDLFKREQFTLGYSFNHEFNSNWKLRHDLRFIDTKADIQALAASTFIPPSTLARAALYGKSNTEALMVDTAIEGVIPTGSASHRLLFGFDYMRSAIDQQLGLNFFSATPVDIWNPIYDLPIAVPNSPAAATVWSSTLDNISQFGIYAQDQIELGRFNLTLNGRYDIAETNGNRTSMFLGADTSAVSKQRDEALSGRAALSYHLQDDLVGYLSYATSFLPLAGLDGAGNGYKPLKSGQWEVGLKYAPANRDLSFTVALFDIRQKNALTPDTDPLNICIGLTGPGPCMVQSGEQRTRGLELETKARIAERTFVHAGFSWLDAKITQSNGPDQGMRPVNVPETTASIWVDHQFDAGLNLGLGLRHVGSVFADPGNTIKVPSHTLVDAAVSFDLGHRFSKGRDAELVLRATNLFDREFTSCSAANYCNYGEGRKISAEFSYKW